MLCLKFVIVCSRILRKQFEAFVQGLRESVNAVHNQGLAIPPVQSLTSSRRFLDPITRLPYRDPADIEMNLEGVMRVGRVRIHPAPRVGEADHAQLIDFAQRGQVTMQDIMDRINAVPGVTARFEDGRLSIASDDPDFGIIMDSPPLHALALDRAFPTTNVGEFSIRNESGDVVARIEIQQGGRARVLAADGHVLTSFMPIVPGELTQAEFQDQILAAVPTLSAHVTHGAAGRRLLVMDEGGNQLDLSDLNRLFAPQDGFHASEGLSVQRLLSQPFRVDNVALAKIDGKRTVPGGHQILISDESGARASLTFDPFEDSLSDIARKLDGLALGGYFLESSCD